MDRFLLVVMLSSSFVVVFAALYYVVILVDGAQQRDRLRKGFPTPIIHGAYPLSPLGVVVQRCICRCRFVMLCFLFDALLWRNDRPDLLCERGAVWWARPQNSIRNCPKRNHGMSSFLHPPVRCHAL